MCDTYPHGGGKIKAKMSKDEHYGYDLHDSAITSGRVDLNDLLKRVKEQKKIDIKINLFIYAGTALVLVVFLLIISI